MTKGKPPAKPAPTVAVVLGGRTEFQVGHSFDATIDLQDDGRILVAVPADVELFQQSNGLVVLKRLGARSASTTPLLPGMLLVRADSTSEANAIVAKYRPVGPTPREEGLEAERDALRAENERLKAELASKASQLESAGRTIARFEGELKGYRDEAADRARRAEAAEARARAGQKALEDTPASPAQAKPVKKVAKPLSPTDAHALMQLKALSKQPTTVESAAAVIIERARPHAVRDAAPKGKKAKPDKAKKVAKPTRVAAKPRATRQPTVDELTDAVMARLFPSSKKK